MERSLVLTEEQKKLDYQRQWFILNPEYWLLRSDMFYGKINKEDAKKNIKKILDLYEEEFKDNPEKKDAYLTGLRDAFNAFCMHLSWSSKYECEKYIEVAMEIIHKDLLSNKLWL